MKVKFIEAGNITEHEDAIEVKFDTEVLVTVRNFSQFMTDFDELIAQYEIKEEG